MSYLNNTHLLYSSRRPPFVGHVQHPPPSVAHNYQQLKDMNVSLMAENSKLDGFVATLSAENRAMKATIVKLELTTQSLFNEVQCLNHQITDLTAQNTQIPTKFELEAQIDELEGALSSAQTEITSLEQKICLHKEVITQLTGQLKETNHEIPSLNSQVVQLEEVVTDLATVNISNLQQKIVELEAVITDYSASKETVTELDAKISMLKETVVEYQGIVNDLSITNEKLREKIATNEDVIHNLKVLLQQTGHNFRTAQHQHGNGNPGVNRLFQY